MKKNNYFCEKGGLYNNTFEKPKSREITINPETVHIDDRKITINQEKEHKKLLYLGKYNKLIYSNNNDSSFSLNYLSKIQRKKIEKYLAQGKTLNCYHRNCSSFNQEFTTLYDYNIHCIIAIMLDSQFIQNFL